MKHSKLLKQLWKSPKILERNLRAIFSQFLTPNTRYIFENYYSTVFTDLTQMTIFVVSLFMTILFLLGANKFLNYPFHSPINTVSDALFGKVLQLSGNRYDRYWEYKLNTNISIKEFRLYTFNIKKPFINVKNTMFQWRNYTSGTRRHYYLKVRIYKHDGNFLCSVLLFMSKANYFLSWCEAEISCKDGP